jgi:serine/threonine protein kinase/tetratricopeptide (TPR) repeat protein
MKNDDRKTCLGCGIPLSADSDSCPVCMLRVGLKGAVGSERLISEPRTLMPDLRALRFKHYKVLQNQDETPMELGRGAMGVTYKAVDTHLECTVALKVIKEKYLADASTRLRFLREARTAARIRHPNVASVFHLGRSGGVYFYAMEFVEGETLEKLINRSGRLEVKLALKIASEVAAGLSAVHKQKLVHRDIKPSNIIVNLEETDAATAKIIDLGLAKAVNEPISETAISIAGAFAGTPEFASPEQFAGIGVDIRSDLYSLGVTLWKMLTGRVPFAGSPAEVMYQHQRTPLPLEKLEDLPQPVVFLIEVLLHKDPNRRFQNPAELLTAISIITGAIAAGRLVTHENLQVLPSADSCSVTERPKSKLGPEKISVARLPVTGRDVFGRDEDIAFLNEAWANHRVNVVTIVAWAGVGKSTLINHWLQGMAAKQYRSAQFVFGWSFYRQGTTNEGSSSADEFLDAALTWFGDPDPRIGTAWEKGERLAKLIAYRRTLLVLDGLEPLQNPPGPSEGRLREPCLQALLRQLAAFNSGLCVITTRLPVADIGDHVSTAAPCRHLEHLSSEAGAQLLRALGVEGQEGELRRASDECNGHCLTLTLLGSYLIDACRGDIRGREEITNRLGLDVREGTHARKVMASYETWFGKGPEVAVLHLLGLFDRPAEEKAIDVLLKSPVIPGLTESLTDLSPSDRQKILARLRRARLVAGTDPYHRGQLDTHPIVREYFGEQLQRERPEAWQECNRRLFHYYRALAPRLPDNLGEMESLFLAVICGCQAGLFREALHEIYSPRIQRGNASFAAKVLGARGALLSVLAHFFAPGLWGSPVLTEVVGQSLTAEDQLFILTQAGMYLTATRGHSTPEARICYERVEILSDSLDRPLLLYSALIGQWRHFLLTGQLIRAMQIAQRVNALAKELDNSALGVGACHALAGTLYYLGDFASAREYATRGVQLWRSAGKSSPAEELSAPAVSCLCYEALGAWHFGEFASCRKTMTAAIGLARELNDTPALAVALFHAAFLGHFERNPVEVERLASDLIELSTRQNFALWLTAGEVLRGWARSVSGCPAEGLARVEDGIRGYRAAGSLLNVSWALALKAECLHRAGRTSEALAAIKEAEAIVESSGERWWCAELNRLRGVFLAATRGDETEIEASLGEAIRIAKEQKSISLTTRAKATHAEYQRQRTSALGGRGIRLPLY